MLKVFKPKRSVNLVIDDYAIRMVLYPRGGGLSKIKSLKEKQIPPGLIEHGRLMNEEKFGKFFRDTVQEWGLKRERVYFYVPDPLVIMKKETYPARLKDDEIKGHFYMELGQTFYLPFENPVFDIYPIPADDENADEREALIFAAPEEELNKYTEIFTDAGLRPAVADIRHIGVYRYYSAIVQTGDEKDSILFFEMNLPSIMISIFSNHIPEFFRFIELDLNMEENWQCENDEEGFLQWKFTGNEEEFQGLIDDQMIELGRILEFYQYSLHKGEKKVSKIVLCGDFPHLEKIRESIEKHTSLRVKILDGFLTSLKDERVPRSFIPALGLALKGEVH